MISDNRYRSNQEKLNSGRSWKYSLYKGESQIKFKHFLKLLNEEKEFRLFFINLLDDVPYRAYHWETPPVTSRSLDQPFEFVATRNPAIDLPADPGPFRQYFTADKNVAVFDNLGNDAKLIAPAPQGHERNYSHIGVFTEEAPEEQQQDLWQTVGQVTENQLSDQPLWLNTAGGGVAWLHVRLDSRPKYYRYRPYTTA